MPGWIGRSWMIRVFGAAMALWLAALWIAPSSSRAQSVANRLQLGLTTDLFAFTSATTSNDDLNTEVDSKSTRWGLRESVALEVACGMGEMFVFGARVMIGGESQTLELPTGGEQKTSNTALAIGPKLDIMFSPDATVRPFLGFSAAFAMITSDTPATETTLVGAQLQGRVGLRWFIAHGVSIDPALALGWTKLSGEVESGPLSTDVSYSGIEVALQLGLSGWIE